MSQAKDAGIEFLELGWCDSESQVIEEAVLTDALRFIDKARRAGGGALVHCAQGKSRSGTVCVAFVAAQENCSIADALSRCKAADGWLSRTRTL